MAEKLLSVPDVATILGITSSAVYSRIKCGTLRTVLRPNGRQAYAIPMRSVLRYHKRILQRMA